MKIVPVYVGSYVNRQHFRLWLQMKIVPVYVGSYVNRQHFRLRFFVPLCLLSMVFSAVLVRNGVSILAILLSIGYGFCTLVFSSLGMFF